MTRPTSRVPSPRCVCVYTRVYVRAHTRSPRYPSGCNKSPPISDDRCYRTHTPGRWNELRVRALERVCVCVCARKCKCVRWKFIYLSEDPKRKVISLPVLSLQFRLAGRGGRSRAGNIGTRDNDICQGRYEVENVCRYL